MTDHSHKFKIGAGSYQIDFERNSIRFFHIGKKGNRLIGTASFTIQGKGNRKAALFSGSISHPSPRIVEELATVAEGIFKEHNPKVQTIIGHRVWHHPKKPPQSRSHSDPKPMFPKRKTGLPRRKTLRHR